MQRYYDSEYAIIVKDLYKEFKIGSDKRLPFIRGVINAITANTPKRKIIAINNISFNVKKGEMLGLTGPNGSGKSTLLSLICGILKPNSGKISVNGKVSAFMQLGIGFEPELSAKENVFLYGVLLGMPEKQIKENFREILGFAELEGFENAKLKNYSWGMKSRLAFSIAVQDEFDILLLDEVLAVGDLRFKEKCIEKIKQFRKEGKTIILVSHDEESIEKFCDRCILVRHGRIVKEGAPKEVIAFYEEDIRGDV